MTHHFDFSIISINFDAKKRTTTARIMSDDTGEIFTGRAHLHPTNEINFKLGADIAISRALRKLAATVLEDEINLLKDLAE